jgi:copper chaperone CopZ
MALKTIQINIEGMSCGHCEKAVANILKGLEGVTDSSVSLPHNTAKVTFDDDRISQQHIVEAVNASQVYKATV